MFFRVKHACSSNTYCNRCCCHRTLQGGKYAVSRGQRSPVLLFSAALYNVRKLKKAHKLQTFQDVIHPRRRVNGELQQQTFMSPCLSAVQTGQTLTSDLWWRPDPCIWSGTTSAFECSEKTDECREEKLLRWTFTAASIVCTRRLQHILLDLIPVLMMFFYMTGQTINIYTGDQQSSYLDTFILWTTAICSRRTVCARCGH